MNSDNPALDALKGIVDDQTKARTSDKLKAVVNGIKTCGPIFCSALASGSIEIDKDIDEMLASTRDLINEVNQQLVQKDISISDSERAAICAFCIRVVAENWANAQEVFGEWVTPITQALTKTGLSAEYRSTDFHSMAGSGMMANIIASGDLFNALNSDPQVPFDDDIYMNSVRELHKASSKAVEKLSQFHIPYEDADLIQHHIKMQASRIFVAVIRCEFRAFNDNQRLCSITESTQAPPFSFEETYRKYRIAMDSFITSIYVNSRVVN